MGDVGSKPVSEWTMEDLTALNVSVQNVNVDTFFGTPDLPKTEVSRIIVEQDPEDIAETDEEHEFFHYSFYAISPSNKGSVDDFGRFLLRLLHFNHDRLLIRWGQGVWVKSDISVQAVDFPEETLLQIQTEADNAAPERVPQLLTGALAAFQGINRLHERESSPILQEKSFLAIAMVGARLDFYKIFITQEFNEALKNSRIPTQPTFIQKLIVPVPDHDVYLKHGLYDSSSCMAVFQCLEAIKANMVSS
ncbi:hypothetical protein DL96DRAFT_1716913 [Flagelloscypha sp. PMI_526]|nr:hypothetical protein DL96DRAFT_1716913 [Flagelloscypha sp. PMI_526]